MRLDGKVIRAMQEEEEEGEDEEEDGEWIAYYFSHVTGCLAIENKNPSEMLNHLFL